LITRVVTKKYYGIREVHLMKLCTVIPNVMIAPIKLMIKDQACLDLEAVVIVPLCLKVIIASRRQLDLY
jgi:hypothetical protein